MSSEETVKYKLAFEKLQPHMECTSNIIMQTMADSKPTFS